MHKIDKLHAVKIGVITQYKAAERPPVRAIAQRLGAAAVIRTLENLGFDLNVQAATADTEDNDRFGQRIVADHAIPVAELDKALADTGISISERIRFKYSVDRFGLLKR